MYFNQNCNLKQKLYFNQNCILTKLSFKLQGGLFGLAGKFPPSYTGAVVQGQGLGGIFATATNVLILTFGISNMDAAFYNFLIAVIFLTVALIASISMTKSPFYQVNYTNVFMYDITVNNFRLTLVIQIKIQLKMYLNIVTKHR